jgi:GcrA cell cycle regulator
VANAWDKHWDDAAIALLTELWMSGYSSGECGRALGVSRSAAIGKINRLGLMRRDRPRMPIMARRPVAQLLLKTTEQVSRPPKRPQKPQMRTNKRPLPPPEPYQAPPPPPEPPIGRFDLLDLRNGHCRWPEGSRAPYAFCGRPQASQSSYCEDHTRRSLSGLARGVPYVGQRMARS